MNKLPFFAEFEKKIRGFIDGILGAWKQKKRLMLVAYILFSLVVAGSVIFLMFGAFVSGLSAIGVLRENINAPQSELFYEKKEENQNEDGQYVTIFDIRMYEPQGKIGKVIYKKPGGCGEFQYITGGSDFKEGILYAVGEYISTCITDEPIIDDFKLFKIID